MIYQGSRRPPIFGNISNKAAYSAPERSLGNRWEDWVPPPAIPSPGRARSLLSLLIYWSTHLQMGCSSWAFCREVGWKQVFNQAWDSLTRRWQFRICWVISVMAPDGLGSKGKQSTAAWVVCYVCTHTALCPQHAHMPKFVSSEVWEGPEHAAPGHDLVGPLQPKGAMPEYEMTWRSA